MPEAHEGLTRRNLLLLGWGGAILHLIFAAFASVRFLVPNVLYEPSKLFRLKKPEDYPRNGVTFVEEQKIFIVKKEEGIRAVSAVCTHLRCTVSWGEASHQFFCPCHGSKFDQSGKNIAGPAPAPLEWYQVSLGRDGRIIVDMGREVEPEAALKI